MRHLYLCPLRWSDMDAFGHVNNAVFLRYLEEARIDLIFRVAREASVTGFAGGSVVARHEIDYLRPLAYRAEPVAVELWVTRIGGASITVGYEVKDPPGIDVDADTVDAAGGATGEGDGAGAGEPTVYARASSVVVTVDLAQGTPRRLTDEERAFLEKYLEEGPVAAA